MPVEIHTCEQGSPDWYACRLGIPTASMFATILAKAKGGGGDSATRKTYLLKLAGEIVTGQPADHFVNSDMERGHAMEPEAREHYAFLHDAEPELIGFIRNGPKGCSPDSLLGDKGLLEIKTKVAHRHLECLLRDDFPPEHRAQCQGALWVSEREWIDLAVYWPGLPMVVKRAYRDEAYIETLAEAVDAFNAELAEIVAKVRAYGRPAQAEAA